MDKGTTIHVFGTFGVNWDLDTYTNRIAEIKLSEEQCDILALDENDCAEEFFSELGKMFLKLEAAQDLREVYCKQEE